MRKFTEKHLDFFKIFQKLFEKAIDVEFFFYRRIFFDDFTSEWLMTIVHIYADVNYPNGTYKKV